MQALNSPGTRPASSSWRLRAVMFMLCVHAWAPLWAQFRKPAFNRISSADGLSHTVVNDICQDTNGFLWIGTQEGLNRFDGRHFKIFMHNPADNRSISNNYIRCILEDSQGDLWVGTAGGLNRMRRGNLDFERYTKDNVVSNSLPDSSIRVLYQDRQERLWIGTYQGGLAQYQPESDNFRHWMHHDGDAIDLGHNQIQEIAEDPAGRLWVASSLGGLSLWRDGTFEFFQHDPSQPHSIASNRIRAMSPDAQGNLWLGYYDPGLGKFDPNTGKTRHINLPGMTTVGGVTDILIRENGHLWLATYGNGLYDFDSNTETFRRMTHDPTDPTSISANTLRTLFQDRGGLLWIGAYEAGLNTYNPKTSRFGLFSPLPNGDNGYASLRAAAEDSAGNLWLGSDGGGFCRFDPQAETFEWYRNQPNNPNSLTNNRVTEMLWDETGILWVGTFGGGLNRFNPKTGDFKGYNSSDKPGAIQHDTVSAAYLDQAGRLWLGTYGNGLERMDRQTETFTQYPHQDGVPGSIEDTRIWSLSGDDQGAIWIGTYSSGLALLNPNDGHVTHYRHDPDNPESIAQNGVFVIYRDGRNRFWLGTNNGLSLAQQQDDKLRFKSYGKKNGLPMDSVYGLALDHNDMLWIAGNHGVARLDTTTDKVTLYNKSHGLQADEFKEGGYLQTGKGRILFGGQYGFNFFDPTEIQFEGQPPPVLPTEYLEYHKPVEAVRLRPDKPLTLSHTVDVFSIQFAALDFTAPKLNHYAYRMEGFSETWIDNGTDNSVTFTRLKPGRYQLRVKGSNNDGIWNETGFTIPIRITPPIWMTWWAYVFYTIVAIGLLSTAHQLRTRAQRRELQRQRTLVARLKDVDRMKDAFLANTSHELRTPLHGMIGLVDAMMENPEIPTDSHNQLRMVAASGRRLAGLVNNLLDFSKPEALNLESIDMHALADTVLPLIMPLAADKPITIQNRINPELPPVRVDENKLQQVLYNLLGNAVKFTEKGQVWIAAVQEEDKLRLSVGDTGIGIEPIHFERIFQSFEQVDGSVQRRYGGTGLGLAISRDLINRHGGTISVESEAGEGSLFSFTLPVSDKPAANHIHAIPQPAAVANPTPVKPGGGQGGDIHILAVDDEPINLAVMGKHLSKGDYGVSMASSGPEALAVLEKDGPPDLILLDVMMPDMSGLEVCRIIRERYPAHELPVLFITAKTRLPDLVEGFEAGANDYITKPVARGELLSRIGVQLQLLEANRRLDEHNRTLEDKVASRTHALRERNEELENLNEVIKAVNREIRMDAVLAKLVEQGLELLESADQGAFLSANADHTHFHFARVVGLGEHTPEAQLGYQRTLDFFKSEDHGVSIHHIGDTDLSHILPGFNPPDHLLALDITLQQRTEGFLLLGWNGEAGFIDDALRMRCSRFREHALTAFGKSKMFLELEETTRVLEATQEQLVSAAHAAGMSENAAEVLHEVGNALNSVNISVDKLQRMTDEDRAPILLGRIMELISQRQADLADFFTSDERGRKIPQVLMDVMERMKSQSEDLAEEIGCLEENLANIKQGVWNQLKYTDQRAETLPTDLVTEINEAVAEVQTRLDDHQVRVKLSSIVTPKVKVARAKFRKVLTILLHNAVDALAERDTDRDIHIDTTRGPLGEVVLTIRDNGSGLQEQDLGRIFGQGYTSRADRSGGNLHFAANAVNEMGGRIQATSDGPGHGAAFILNLKTASVS